MKKVLALVLAVVLAFGMTTVAFAAVTGNSGTKNIAIDANVYTYDKDAKTEKASSAILFGNNMSLAANETYYIPVNDGSDDISKISDLKNYKVRSSIDTGASYIASKPAFVIKDKQAFITFKTADKFNMEAQDFEMTITIYPDADFKVDSGNAAAEKSYALAGEIKYSEVEVSNYKDVDGKPVVKFDDDAKDVELNFNDKATFEVNAEGQKDLFLRLTDEDEALEDKYPEAALDIRYFDGNNKTFRRSGTLTIAADMVEGKDGKMVAPFIYTNENGKLVVFKDAKYDEDAEKFVIKTNKLGKYVISDVELKADAATDKGDGAETNPDTGANDFVGLAVALAVVSVAGIAVAKRK
ncbi:hypothetical protein [Hydrogenoanaerobacterium sp.]|uniref:hypothetical protein n=1 Tax=Hydrogenoanaerobacterium sp. TaxID=2953763 RepID=UPI00289A3F9F|nr:hypothetical protein [Hydrogenoanaerobacterium sp.]